MDTMTSPPTRAAPPLTWSQLADPDPGHRTLWAPSTCATRLVPCGQQWDAVAVRPLRRGLRVLDLIGLPLDAGYPVLADYLRAELYVMVAPGTGADLREPHTRVLSAGSWLLLPHHAHGSASALWLSTPSDNAPLVPARRLRRGLHHLDREAT